MRARAISDAELGIAPGLADKLFEPFVTTKEDQSPSRPWRAILVSPFTPPTKYCSRAVPAGGDPSIDMEA